MIFHASGSLDNDMLSVLNDRLSGLVQTRLGIKSDFGRFNIGNKLNRRKKIAKKMT